MRLPRAAAEAVIYTRRGCPPCYEMKRLAGRASRRHGITLVVADVDSDPVLRATYGERVPVLVLPGGVSVEGHPVAQDVEEAFERAARGAPEEVE